MLKAGVLHRLSLAAGAVAVQCCAVAEGPDSYCSRAVASAMDKPEKLKVFPNEKSFLQLPVIIVMLTLEKAGTKV